MRRPCPPHALSLVVLQGFIVIGSGDLLPQRAPGRVTVGTSVDEVACNELNAPSIFYLQAVSVYDQLQTKSPGVIRIFKCYFRIFNYRFSRGLSKLCALCVLCEFRIHFN